MVETHDGRPTKIEGNPEHPDSLGAASAFAQASVLEPLRSGPVLERAADGRESNWQEFAKFASDHFGKLGDGTGLRFVSETIASPSYSAVKKAALKKWPESEVDRVRARLPRQCARRREAGVRRGAEARHPNFEKAKVVVALESDFLGLDASTVLPVKQFAKARHAGEPGETEMNRLYAVESNFSITGAMADHRLRLRSSEVLSFAQELARELGVLPASLKVLNGGDKRQKFIAAAARDLKAHAGECLVVAGRRQPAAVHALALALNEKLGNFGQTLTFTKCGIRDFRDRFAEGVGGRDLARRSEDGRDSRRQPGIHSPANLRFEASLKSVPVSIHLGPGDRTRRRRP